MGEDSLTGNFQMKLTSFMENMNLLEKNSKLPVWFKPFMESVKKFATDVSDTFAELEGRLVEQKSITDALAEDRERLKAKMEIAETKLEDQLQYTRRNMLLIHGVDESDGPENTDETVINIFKEMDVPIEKKDINRSHRLGRRTQNPSNSQEDREKKRPIIVSFISYWHKKQIYDKKKET